MIVSPSFLTADFEKLEAEIRSIQFASWLHFDVMDGRFVPATTYTHEIVRRIKQFSPQFFDVHLMIDDPGKEIVSFAAAGADLITFHLEAAPKNAFALIGLIRSLDCQCGISVKPATPVEDLVPYLSAVDLVLVMSVEPGKGGQKFMPQALEKIRYLAKFRTDHELSYQIEVDGGINLETVEAVKAVGADVIVVGSAVFSRSDRKAAILELENA